MADPEALNQRLARLAVSREESWAAVREAQTLVRTGIANFEQRVPRWVEPTQRDSLVAPYFSTGRKSPQATSVALC